MKSRLKLSKALYYEDKNAYSRNRAVGMSFLNRFIIEEDNQFECAGVVDCQNYTDYPTLENLEKRFEQILNESNSDFICHLVLSFMFFPSIPVIPDFPFMITRIGKERLRCVQKEQCEKLYKKASNEGAKITYKMDRVQIVYKSIGDDIDDFYTLIKMNNLIFSVRRPVWSYNLIETAGSVTTYHLSMLSDEEIKIHSEKNSNRLMNFKNETKLSGKEQNYALSLCARKTIYCDRRIFRLGYWDRVWDRVWDIVEPYAGQQRKLTATGPFGSELPEGKNFTCNVFTISTHCPRSVL